MTMKIKNFWKKNRREILIVSFIIIIGACLLLLLFYYLNADFGIVYKRMLRATRPEVKVSMMRRTWITHYYPKNRCYVAAIYIYIILSFVSQISLVLLLLDNIRELLRLYRGFPVTFLSRNRHPVQRLEDDIFGAECSGIFCAFSVYIAGGCLYLLGFFVIASAVMFALNAIFWHWLPEDIYEQIYLKTKLVQILWGFFSFCCLIVMTTF